MRALNIETVDTGKGPRITADTDVEILVAGGAEGAGIDARAIRMVYAPVERKFTFSGAASVKQQSFETRAPEIFVTLGAAGGFTVDSLEATGGTVNIKSLDRTADGTHLLYAPATGKVMMTGTPVKLSSQGKSVQGKSVTFFTSGDQVEVVGEEGRTETVLQRKIKQ